MTYCSCGGPAKTVPMLHESFQVCTTCKLEKNPRRQFAWFTPAEWASLNAAWEEYLAHFRMVPAKGENEWRVVSVHPIRKQA
jgi:hypothetical protein